MRFGVIVSVFFGEVGVSGYSKVGAQWVLWGYGCCQCQWVCEVWCEWVFCEVGVSSFFVRLVLVGFLSWCQWVLWGSGCLSVGFVRFGVSGVFCEWVCWVCFL